ncbi:hypothetical protein SAMN04487895_12520 [Paenibacillus sophorae]|uniref:Phage integrase family protein n=1 Tax=Paenibacillus sophorae TaxID=1333845 RepID=A0A1H8VKJ8_9BACL|nr:hypothetical protein SAMN04487895_12520 [Paenibacillus sophorae]
MPKVISVTMIPKIHQPMYYGKRVGHDDAKTTLKVYTHVTNKMRRNDADKLKIHFANILNPINPQEK